VLNPGIEGISTKGKSRLSLKMLIIATIPSDLSGNVENKF
jgi:hypothetical protein